MDSQVSSKPSWRRLFPGFSGVDHERDTSERIQNKLRRRVLYQPPALAADVPSNEAPRPPLGILREQVIEVAPEPTKEESGDGPPSSPIAIGADNVGRGIFPFAIKDKGNEVRASARSPSHGRGGRPRPRYDIWGDQ